MIGAVLDSRLLPSSCQGDEHHEVNSTQDQQHGADFGAQHFDAGLHVGHGSIHFQHKADHSEVDQIETHHKQVR